MRALVAWEADRYSHARLVTAETTIPLIDAQDTEDMYSRATLAFACLRERIGDKPIVAALNEVASNAARTGQPARSLDFVQALTRKTDRNVAPVIEMLLVAPVSINAASGRAGCSLPHITARAAGRVG